MMGAARLPDFSEPGLIRARRESFPQALFRRAGRLAYVGIRVRGGEKPRLELRRRKKDAPLPHRMEERRVAPRIGPADVGEVSHRTRREEERQKRPRPGQAEA